jgi:hypothetical protein
MPLFLPCSHPKMPSGVSAHPARTYSVGLSEISGRLHKPTSPSNSFIAPSNDSFSQMPADASSFLIHYAHFSIGPTKI